MDIKAWRKSLKWTQEQMARELDVSLSTLRNWEYGKYEPSKMAQEKIKKLKDSL